MSNTTKSDKPAEAAPKPAPKVDPKLDEERRESMRIASYGAQVILDYDGDAALAARGGAAGSITENTIIRDADLVELGHDLEVAIERSACHPAQLHAGQGA